MEKWLPLNDYQGYEVSDFGKIRSVDRIVYYSDGRCGSYKGRVRKTVPGRNGYPVIQFSIDGVVQARDIHRLVYETFIGPIKPGTVVMHLDDDKTNNHLVNLQNGTQSDNIIRYYQRRYKQNADANTNADAKKPQEGK